MSEELTPLEAWEEVKDEMLEWTEGYEEYFNIIETALKRLEKIETTTHSVLREDISNKLETLGIIKSKEMLSVFRSIDNKYYLAFNMTAIEIPKDEFDLLREVLYETN